MVLGMELLLCQSGRVQWSIYLYAMQYLAMGLFLI